MSGLIFLTYLLGKNLQHKKVNFKKYSIKTEAKIKKFRAAGENFEFFTTKKQPNY